MAPTTDMWAHYRGPALGFDHPAAWIERPQRFIAGSFGSTIAVLSTRQPDSELCYRQSLPNGGEEAGCDSHRLGKLAAGDLVLIVGSSQFPPPNALPAGESLIVDGHDATLSRADSSCAGMGGDKTVTLTILLSASSGVVTLDACGLKVPGLEKTMRRVAASVRLAAA